LKNVKRTTNIERISDSQTVSEQHRALPLERFFLLPCDLLGEELVKDCFEAFKLSHEHRITCVGSTRVMLFVSAMCGFESCGECKKLAEISQL
jgi:hypothetical protein